MNVIFIFINKHNIFFSIGKSKFLRRVLSFFSKPQIILLVVKSLSEQTIYIPDQILIGKIDHFSQNFQHTFSCFFSVFTIHMVQLRRVKVFTGITKFNVYRSQPYRFHVLIMLFTSVSCRWQEKVNVRMIIVQKHTTLILNVMVIKYRSRKTIGDFSLTSTVRNVTVLFKVTVI